MKYLITLFVVFISAIAVSQSEIEINDVPFEIEYNKEFTYITESGDSIVFVLKGTNPTSVPKQQVSPPTNDFKHKKSTSKFSDGLIEFAYLENYAIAKTRPTEELQQLTMVSGDGAGIVIQEFATINPTNLVDFFLSSLVGEELLAVAEPTTATIKNGKQLSGKLTTDIDGSTITVLSYGVEQKGILIALIGDQANDPLLANFLSNFVVKF